MGEYTVTKLYFYKERDLFRPDRIICKLIKLRNRRSVASRCIYYSISWTDHVRNEEVLLRVNEQRNILHEIRKRKAIWIGHILRRNCLLKHLSKER